MLDWPNLLAGAGLGFVLGLIPWVIDRVRGRRSIVAQTQADWSVAAGRIELLIWQPGTTWIDVHRLIAEFPIDLWRRALGPADFRLLERLENAFTFAEFEGMPGTSSTPDEEKRAAVVAFSNRARELRSKHYAEVTWGEDRAKVRRDYLRHPIRTFKRERHNRRVRREAGMPDGF